MKVSRVDESLHPAFGWPGIWLARHLAGPAFGWPGIWLARHGRLKEKAPE
jgi:hypothetical protein